MAVKQKGLRTEVGMTLLTTVEASEVMGGTRLPLPTLCPIVGIDPPLPPIYILLPSTGPTFP